MGRVDSDYWEEQRKGLVEVFKDNNLNWLDPIDSYIIAVTNRMFSFPHEVICGISDIGTIIRREDGYDKDDDIEDSDGFAPSQNCGDTNENS